MIRILVILLKFHMNFDFKDFDQNSSVFQSENLMTMEFLWNSRKLQEKFNQYSDQKIRWPRNSYEILENYRKSLDIPKIPTSAYSSKTFSSLFAIIWSQSKNCNSWKNKQITCSWHQKKRNHEFTNLKCCKMSFKPSKW